MEYEELLLKEGEHGVYPPPQKPVSIPYNPSSGAPGCKGRAQPQGSPGFPYYTKEPFLASLHLQALRNASKGDTGY